MHRGAFQQCHRQFFEERCFSKRQTGKLVTQGQQPRSIEARTEEQHRRNLWRFAGAAQVSLKHAADENKVHNNPLDER